MLKMVVIKAFLIFHFLQSATSKNTFIPSSAENALPTSTLDSSDYYFTRLPGNNLRVVTISSDSATFSGVSLTVSHGYFNDPVHLPGLAHLYEHLVGSSARINELRQNSKLKLHLANSITESQQTTFYLESPPKQLHNALEVLAQSIMKPNFDATSIEQELKTIHEEYSMFLHDDYYKEEQLLKHVSNSGHPFHKFKIGNKFTLNIIDLKEQLLKLHQRIYSASLVSKLFDNSTHY